MRVSLLPQRCCLSEISGRVSPVQDSRFHCPSKGEKESLELSALLLGLWGKPKRFGGKGECLCISVPPPPPLWPPEVKEKVAVRDSNSIYVFERHESSLEFTKALKNRIHLFIFCTINLRSNNFVLIVRGCKYQNDLKSQVEVSVWHETSLRIRLFSTSMPPCILRALPQQQ